MPDTFSVRLDTLSLPLTMDCGQSSLQTLPLSSVNQTIQNINFAIECNAPYDVWIQSLTRSGWVFPGQIHTLRTNITNNSNWFNLNCDTILHSGNVSIQVNGPITYVAPAPNALPPTVNGNTFSYNITDFRFIHLIFYFYIYIFFFISIYLLFHLFIINYFISLILWFLLFSFIYCMYWIYSLI